MSAQKTDVYVATETFTTEYEGHPVILQKGVTRIRAGHELLAKNPGYFAPVELSVDYDVEQATAEPGEKRAVSVAAVPEKPRQASVEVKHEKK